MIPFNLKKVGGISRLFILKKVLSKLDHLHLSGGKLKALRSLKHQHYRGAKTKLANLGVKKSSKAELNRENSLVHQEIVSRVVPASWRGAIIRGC